MNWRVKQALQEIGLAGLLALFVVPLVGTVVGKVGVVESKWYSPAYEVVTEEGVLSIDEGWYVCQWNGWSAKKSGSKSSSGRNFPVRVEVDLCDGHAVVVDDDLGWSGERFVLVRFSDGHQRYLVDHVEGLTSMS